MNVLVYRPPKSSVWGHSLRRMKPQRQRALVRQFLETTTASRQFGMGSLSLSRVVARAPVDEAVRQFESLLGQRSYDGFFPNLSAPDVERCLDAFEADERWYAEFGGSVLQTVAITAWLIDGVPKQTVSTLHAHYGVTPVLGTTLGFDSSEDFGRIKAALDAIGLCKLNEKHLKGRRGRIPT